MRERNRNKKRKRESEKGESKDRKGEGGIGMRERKKEGERERRRETCGFYIPLRAPSRRWFSPLRLWPAALLSPPSIQIRRRSPFVLAFLLSFPLQNLTYPLSLPWLLTRMERRGCHVVPLLAGCPRGLSALSTSAAGLFSGKKKFRLISGHFEKFRLLYEKRKVETHIWTL